MTLPCGLGGQRKVESAGPSHAAPLLTSMVSTPERSWLPPGTPEKATSSNTLSAQGGHGEFRPTFRLSAGGKRPYRPSWRRAAGPTCLMLFAHRLRAAAPRTVCAAGSGRLVGLAMPALTATGPISVEGWRRPL